MHNAGKCSKEHGGRAFARPPAIYQARIGTTGANVDLLPSSTGVPHSMHTGMPDHAATRPISSNEIAPLFIISEPSLEPVNRNHALPQSHCASKSSTGILLKTSAIQRARHTKMVLA